MNGISTALAFFTLAVPVTFLVAAIATRLAPARMRRHATAFSIAAFIFAVVAAALAGLFTGESPTGLSPAIISWVMLVLVSFIAVIVSRYSQQYMAGEASLGRYYKNLHLTLAAVTFTVISDHLLMLLAGWVAISLCLHKLLMFYPHRPRAALAAHKKFLFARLAELSLLTAALLLYVQHGTWYVSDIAASYQSGALGLYDQAAAVLIALTALIKCAQLPVHGWLMQVVEAPTPVSALLHAGIINLGGFLLILFAPLIAQSAAAHWLILVVAGVTTVLAGLIMMTRVSIKLRLAWSTSAQMGLMLIECALGLYALALLHLVAHSCYKAYAFLNAGSAVEAHLFDKLAGLEKPASLRYWLTAATFALALVAVPALLFTPSGPFSPWLLMAVALTLILGQSRSNQRFTGWVSVSGLALFVVFAYSLQKMAASWLVPQALAPVSVVADVWVSALVGLLLAGYLLLRYAPEGRVGRYLWHGLYAGLYLDEWATRITLAIWPVKLPKREQPKHPPHPLVSREFTP